MGAFGTAFTLATGINVLPMVIYTEFTLEANIAVAAALSFVLGAVTWIVLAVARTLPAAPSRRQAEDRCIDRGPLFSACSSLHAAGLRLPDRAGDPVDAGRADGELFPGRCRERPDLGWVGEVWAALRRDDLPARSASRSPASPCTLVLGVPAAYVLAKRQTALDARARGAAGDAGGRAGPRHRAGADRHLSAASGDFRTTWLFILVGHVLFTLPFMVRSVLAVMTSIDLKTLEEGAASLGAASASASSTSCCRTAAPASSPAR